MRSRPLSVAKESYLSKMWFKELRKILANDTRNEKTSAEHEYKHQITELTAQMRNGRAEGQEAYAKLREDHLELKKMSQKIDDLIREFHKK